MGFSGLTWFELNPKSQIIDQNWMKAMQREREGVSQSRRALGEKRRRVLGAGIKGLMRPRPKNREPCKPWKADKWWDSSLWHSSKKRASTCHLKSHALFSSKLELTHPFISKRIGKRLWWSHAKEYYSAGKRNKILMGGLTSMNLKGIMLSQRVQKRRVTAAWFSLSLKFWRKKNRKKKYLSRLAEGRAVLTQGWWLRQEMTETYISIKWRFLVEGIKFSSIKGYIIVVW